VNKDRRPDVVVANWRSSSISVLLVSAPSGPIDHFKCYKTMERKRVCEGDLGAQCKTDADCAAVGGPCLGFPQGVRAHLADQFEEGLVNVKKPIELCTPVDKDGGGIRDPETHLEAYRIERAKGELPHARRTVVVQDQFGLRVLGTIKEDRLLVPTSKSLSGPVGLPSSDLDHFKCYGARELKNVCTGDFSTKCKADADCAAVGGICNLGFPKGVTVTLADQFETTPVEVRKPKLLCLPVDKNGEGIANPVGHLLCYGIERSDGLKHTPVGGIHTNNQFGPGVLSTIKEELLCVPAVKNP